MTTTPYYEDGQVTLWHARDSDILPTLSTGTVGAVITDPPWNVSHRNGRDGTTPGRLRRSDGSTREVRRDFGDWDRDWSPAVLIAELPRILRPSGSLVAFTSEHLMADWLKSGLNHRNVLAWRKPGPVEGSEGGPMTGDDLSFEEALNLLGDVKFRFWTCPIPGHSTGGELRQTVEWDGDVACCLFPGCLRRSDYERNSCECEIYDCEGGCCGGQCSCVIEAARRCPDFPECREERYVSDLLASVKAGEPVGKWVSGCVECDRLAEEVGR